MNYLAYLVLVDLLLEGVKIKLICDKRLCQGSEGCSHGPEDR